MIKKASKLIVLITGGFLLLSVVLLGRQAKQDSPTTTAPQLSPKIYTKSIGTGVEFYSSQQPEIPLIKYDSCSIGKITYGGISLGAFNELRVDHLTLNLSDHEEINLRALINEFAKYNSTEKTKDTTNNNKTEPASLLKQLNASRIRINKLEVNSVNTNQIQHPVLSCSSALSGLDGIMTLKNCKIFTAQGTTQHSTEAKWNHKTPSIIIMNGSPIELPVSH